MRLFLFSPLSHNYTSKKQARPGSASNCASALWIFFYLQDDVKTIFLKAFKANGLNDSVRHRAVRFKFRGGKYIVNSASPKLTTHTQVTGQTDAPYLPNSTYS